MKLARKSVAMVLVLVLTLMTMNSFAFANEPQSNSGGGKQVMLANNGKAMYKIHVAPTAGAMERHAAEELADYLTRVTGAAFQLDDGDRPPNGHVILVGRNALTESLVPELSGDSLGEDGFVIRSVQRFIVIAGSHARGTMYGVNYFLDYYVGVKWYAPDYTYVPNIGKLKLRVDNDVQVPRFVYREFYANEGGDEQFRAHNLLNGKFRDRYGQVPQSEPHLDDWSQYWPYDVHNFYKIVPQTEYHYGGQLLAMNENVRQIAAENLIRLINQRISQGYDPSYSFSQEDWYWTPDPDSLAFADQHGETLAAPIFDMVSDVAERVRAVIPDARIGTLAYMFTEQAPTDMTVADNVVITFAPIDKDHGRPLNDPKNRFSGDNARQWAAISDHIVLWDYLIDFSGGGYLMPYPSVYAMAETIQYIAQFPAFKGYFGQHMHGLEGPVSTGLNDLRTWVAARLLWNPDQDYRQLIDQFLQGYYGDAAPYIAEYIERLHESFEQSDSTLRISTPITSSYLTFDLMYEADQLFAQAEAAVADQPDFFRHVQRSRVDVDYVILMRSVEFAREAMQRNLDWDIDYDNRYARFKENTAHVQYYKIGSSMESLYEVLEIKRTVPPVPDIVEDLPESDWVDLQDNTFWLYAPAGATLVNDPKASDNAAARVKGTTNEWAIQLPGATLPKEGEWKLYASVRIDPGDGEPGDKAFDFGIWPPFEHIQSPDYAEFADGEYHWIEFPWTFEYDPEVAHRYVWFAPPNSTAIEYLYVDRVVAVRQ